MMSLQTLERILLVKFVYIILNFKMLNHHNHKSEEVVAAATAIRDIVRAHAIIAKLRHNHHDAKVGVTTTASTALRGCVRPNSHLS